MQISFKRYVVFLFSSVLLSGSIFAMEITGSSEAINIAGKQRMLSYRILKSYLMVSMDSVYKDPKGSLAKAITDFSEAKKALASYSKDESIQSLTKEVEDAFAAVKKMVSEPFDTTKEEEYLKKATEMKILSHKIVLRLQEIAGSSASVIVNKSGRLRAVSQRMNALYLLKTMGVSASVVNNGMKASMKLFREHLDFLKRAELKDAEIIKRLKKLEKIYLFFQIMNESDSHVPTIITKKSDKMLKYSDELTSIYVEKLK